MRGISIELQEWGEPMATKRDSAADPARPLQHAPKGPTALPWGTEEKPEQPDSVVGALTQDVSRRPDDSGQSSPKSIHFFFC